MTLRFPSDHLPHKRQDQQIQSPTLQTRLSEAETDVTGSSFSADQRSFRAGAEELCPPCQVDASAVSSGLLSLSNRRWTKQLGSSHSRLLDVNLALHVGSFALSCMVRRSGVVAPDGGSTCRATRSYGLSAFSSPELQPSPMMDEPESLRKSGLELRTQDKGWASSTRQ